MRVRFVVREAVVDEELSALHARAFGGRYELRPWRHRLTEHSLSSICARGVGERLVGFANVAWDGGAHAFLLDVVVDADHRHRGVGAALVRRTQEEAAAAGCEWLHVDFEPHLRDFYLDACGFRPSAAGVLRLADPLGVTGAATPRPL